MKKNNCISPRFTSDEIRFFKQINSEYQISSQRRYTRLRILNIALLIVMVGAVIVLSGVL